MLVQDATRNRAFYRKDIDSLRAIAVLAVIGFHFSAALIPSGYLGVDIFFAISGFVITASLLGRTDNTLTSFVVSFYSLRIRRLWPGLLLCVIVTALVSCLFDPDPVATLRTGIAALFGLSNIYLYKQATDYLGSWAALNSFTHTWSLGVEEQFYCIFPLIYWFGLRPVSRRRWRLAFILMAATAIASLGAFLFIHQSNQPAAFFLVPMRWWELMAGCLTFLVLRRRTQVWLPPAAIVLAALFATLFLPERYNQGATITAVGLTCLLLLSVREGSAFYRVFTYAPFSYIGLLSYSLYLWHWPVLVISRMTIGIHLRFLPTQLGLVLLLAMTAYHFVERPLRSRLWFPSRGLTVATGLFGSAASAAILLFLLFPASGRLYTGKPVQRRALITVVTPPQPEGDVVLIGDSHADQFSNLGASLAARHSRRFTLINYAATLFPTGAYSTPNDGLTRAKSLLRARDINARVEQVLRSPSPQAKRLIILSSFYTFYFSAPVGRRKYQILTHYDDRGNAITSQQALAAWLGKLDAFAIQHSFDTIVVILSTPEMPEIYPRTFCEAEWFRPKLSTDCYVQVSRSTTRNRLAGVNSLIASHAATHANLLVFDPFDVLCPAPADVCPSEIDGVRIYNDEDHLSEAGSQKVSRALEDFLVQRGAFAAKVY